MVVEHGLQVLLLLLVVAQLLLVLDWMSVLVVERCRVVANTLGDGQVANGLSKPRPEVKAAAVVEDSTTWPDLQALL